MLGKKLFGFLFLIGAFTQAAEISQIIVLGDSLTEGFGVSKSDAYPNLLQGRIARAGHANLAVINAGIGGSTSASAVPRVKWQLQNKPAVLILALGANDGLRGLKPEETFKNLGEAILLAQENKIKVLLVGMIAPPNYGKDYTRKFQAVFPDLAKKYHVPLVPFLLENVAGNPQLNQPDGLHPNEKGHQIMAKTVLQHLLPIL